tara:strand:+ start:162 stop:539 length:378 start_codon:yes stop_codon:yes gene_type:complete
MGLEGKKLLVVDDSSTMRAIIKKQLKDIGFTNVILAEDGAQGLKFANEKNFDLIISDWNMPKMTGLEFLKAVRADGKLKETAFMLLTSVDDKDSITEALKAGVNQYIIKPFTANQLQDKINLIKF